MAYVRFPARSRPRLLGIIGVAAWLAVVAAGLLTLTAHGAAAGPPASPPAELPADGELSPSLRRAGRAMLVVAAHPACPCTRATLRQLERVLASTRPADSEAARGADVVVLFGGPLGDARTDRIASDLRAIAAAIPGVRLVDDPGGVQTASLGAKTSGTVLFYDRTGRLRFNGGITPGRGHEGDSAGADALRALLREEAIDDVPAERTSSSATSVFGCELFDRSERP